MNLRHQLLIVSVLLLASLFVPETVCGDVANAGRQEYGARDDYNYGDGAREGGGAGSGGGVDVAVEVEVDLGWVKATTDAAFVCATLDWYMQDRCSYGSCSWGHASILELNLTHPLLEKSLQALSPLRLRLGGTVQDEIVYGIGLSDPATQCLPLQPDATITGYRGGCLSMERWVALHQLFAKTGTRVVFGLNALYKRVRLDSGTWGPWDSSNARDLIKFTIEKGITVEGWELGNELTANHVVTSLPATQYGEDLKQLRFLVNSLYQGSSLPKPLVVAPDSTGNVAGPEYEWYSTFLRQSGEGVVDAVSRHIYNLGPGDSTNLVERILDPSVLDNDLGNFRAVQQIIKTTAPWASAWVGEAGGAYNSGKDLVSNAFINSFWYVDQLAMAATFNTKAYCRQTLIGGNYGLLNSTTFRPNPDLYSAILFKRLMGTKVLSTTVTTTFPKLRAYAHCQAGSPSGGLSILLINLSDSPLQVTLRMNSTNPQEFPSTRRRQEYHLSAPNGELQSQSVLLNGVPLELTSLGDLPNLDIPVEKEHSEIVAVEAFSIVFAVAPDAHAPICLAG